MARAVTRIGAFLEQKLFHWRRAIENKLIRARRHQHALLNHAEFDLEDLRQMFVAQRLKDYSLIDAVHKLRRKLAASRVYGGALNLVVEVVVDFHGFRRETKAAVDQVGHLAGAQVRGQDDDALRKIDAAVIAERERGFVQNAKQKLPERVGSFF